MPLYTYLQIAMATSITYSCASHLGPYFVLRPATVMLFSNQHLYDILSQLWECCVCREATIY